MLEKQPQGYGDRQVVSFKNAKNELIEALRVITEDAKCLVKVSSKLKVTMENYDEDDYEDFDDDDLEGIQPPEDLED